MGPLAGIRVVEIAGLGPGPFCAMMLADMGAEVIRIDRPGGGALSLGDPSRDLLNRGRRSASIDLKNPDGRDLVLRLIEQADVLVEGFRPGVTERLGIGPDDCLRRNPRLVYGRMTGWGQEGPLAAAAGHDINYIAVAGVLDSIGRAGSPPTPPLNLVGDFGGGGLLLAFGIAAALVERDRSGRGQVVDAAMVDGSALLATMLHSMLHMGTWQGDRGRNLLDSGAPFYDVYETADGRFVAVGALEPQFYAELLDGLDLVGEDLPAQYDVAGWPVLRDRFSAVFGSKTRDEWEAAFAGSDACVAPVLSPREAPRHPHNRSRATFVEMDGVAQPAPAPRFGRTPPAVSWPPPRPGEHTTEALSDWGLSPAEIDALRAAGALG